MLDSFAEKKKTPVGRLTLILLGAFFVACVIGALFVGDLAKLQEPVFAKESQAALRDVDDPAAVDQVLQKYSANKILRLVALAKKDATERDAAARKLLAEAEPAALAKPVDLTAASRADLDALRASLKAAEGQAAAFKSRFDAMAKAKRDEVEKEVRTLSVGSDTLAKFMAVITRSMPTSRLTSPEFWRRAPSASRLRQMRSTSGQGIRLLQDHQRPVHLPRAIDGRRLQCRCRGDGGGRKAHERTDEEGAALKQAQLKRWKEFVGG